MSESATSTERAIWALAAALSASMTSADVAVAVAEHSAPAVGAAFSNFAVYDQVLGQLHAVHGSVLDPEVSRRWEAFPLDSDTSLGAAILTRRPVLLRTIDDVGAQFPKLRDDTVAAGLAATASLPLLAPDGSAIGAVGFAWNASHAFNDEEVARLSVIAEVASQALDRALLYERERKYLSAVDQAQADLLQSAFLPAEFPLVPGLEAAAAYLPASGAPMGGDWYDAFPVGGGTCFVIGDVAGHGLPAAAVMAQLRNAIRAFGCEDPDPARMLERANRLLRHFEPEATATAIVAVWDPKSQTLVRANAGHPAPLRCRTDEAGYLTPPRRHVLLGALADHVMADERMILRPGTTMLFFTDGLIEDRRSSLDEGMAQLRDFVATLDDLSPRSLCQALVRWRGGRPERDDDMCVLALKVADRRVRDVGRTPDRRRAPGRSPGPGN